MLPSIVVVDRLEHQEQVEVQVPVVVLEHQVLVEAREALEHQELYTLQPLQLQLLGL